MRLASVIGVDNCFGVFLPDEISEEQWQKIFVTMRNRGHPFSDVDQTRRCLLQIAGEPKYISCAFFDWVSTVIYVFNLYPVRPAPEIPAPRVIAALSVATQEWGTTDNPCKGGFILEDGLFLDMSCGLPKRKMDHVCINQFLKLPKDHSLELWESNGLIRWNSEGRGVSIMARPSPGQLATIEKLAEYHPEKPFHMDAYEYRFGFGGQRYPAGVRGSRMIQDLLNFYETGYITPLGA